VINTGEAEDTLDLSYAVDLQTNFDKAHQSLQERTAELQVAKQHIERLKAQTIQMQTEYVRLQESNSRHQLQLRYIKALKG
jgi:hypothetical protein